MRRAPRPTRSTPPCRLSTSTPRDPASYGTTLRPHHGDAGRRRRCRRARPPRTSRGSPSARCSASSSRSRMPGVLFLSRRWAWGEAGWRTSGRISGRVGDLGAFYLTLVPIRPRRRGERRFLKDFSRRISPPTLAFNPRPRRLSTPPDAFELHPDIRSYGTTLRWRRMA